MPKVPYESPEAKFSVDVWASEDANAIAMGYTSYDEAKADFDKMVASGAAFAVELNQWTGDAATDGWKLMHEWPDDGDDDLAAADDWDD